MDYKEITDSIKATIADNMSALKTASEEGRKEIMAEMVTLSGRLDSIETKQNRPDLATPGEKKEIIKKAWNAFGKQGNIDELKYNGMITGTTAEGGALISSEMSQEIVAKILPLSPIRQEAKVSTTSQGTILFPTTDADATVTWTAEATAGSSITAPMTWGQVTIATNDMRSLVLTSQKLLDDSQFDVETEIYNELVTAMAYAEGAAFATGSGTTRPYGIVGSTTITSGRASTCAATGFAEFADILTIYGALPSSYYESAVWMMSPATFVALANITDTVGQPVGKFSWVGTGSNVEPIVLGKRVIFCDGMSAPTTTTANTIWACFGSIQHGYRVVDTTAGAHIWADRYTSPGNVKFFLSRAVGGNVVCTDAFRYLYAK